MSNVNAVNEKLSQYIYFTYCYTRATGVLGIKEAMPKAEFLVAIIFVSKVDLFEHGTHCWIGLKYE